MSQGSHDSETSHASATPDADTLIGRLLDREATGDDRMRFECLADSASDLWKTLALRQLDMAELSDRVCAATEPADRVDVIAATPPRRWQAGFALSGWAAAIVLGMWWAATPREARGPQVQPAVNPPPSAVPADALTPAELLRRYMASDFVVGPWEPILKEQEDLGDGRHKIWFVRRIEETAIIDRPLDEVVGRSGNFLVDPADLRRD